MSQAGILNTTVIPPPPTVVETLTGNTGGAVGPTGNNINFIGSGLVNIVGTPGTSTLVASINEQVVSAQQQANLNNLTGDGTLYQLIFDGVNFQTGSSYNSATGVFTAPATGNYLVSTNVTLNSITAGNTFSQLAITTTTQNFYSQSDPSPFATSNLSLTRTAICTMTAGNTLVITITVSNGTKTVGITGNNLGSYTDLSITRIS
jgi:C1q domain-containing protein